MLLLGCRGFSFSSRRRKFGNKGVRISKYSHTGKKIICLKNKTGTGRGVRNDNVIYSLPQNTTKHTLHDRLEYSKPCVCGSLSHALTTHMNCLLNRRYEDAYE